MQNPVPTVKKFVARNQTKILVTAATVTTAVALIQRTAINQHNDFLRQKGLYDEFYAQTDE